MSFTFKRNKPEGQYRSFYQIQTDVKVKGKVVGSIHEGRGFSDWSVRLFLKDEEFPHFKSVKLKKTFASEKAARDWLKEKHDLLYEKYDIVSLPL